VQLARRFGILRAWHTFAGYGTLGSGKTTLLSLLGCLLSPDEGTVFVDGVEVNGLSEAERTVVRQRKSVLFSKRSAFFTLFPRLTMSHLALNFVMQPCQAERKWQEICSLIGLGDKLNQEPNELSPGEKQRVAIARALAGNPPYF